MPRATTIQEFIEAKVTQLQGVSGLRAAHFMPELDLVRYLEAGGQFPVALVTDGGGTKDRYNRKLQRRWLDVTLCNMEPTDSLAERQAKALLALGVAMVAALANGDADALWVVEDGSLEGGLAREGGEYVCTKTWRFEYEIQEAA